MTQFSSTAFLCFEEISSMRQISSIMHPRHDDYFEDISCTEEISSNSERHRPNDKKQIEENCKDTEISSTKNSPTLKISRKTEYFQKSPRATGFPASPAPANTRPDSTEASQNSTKNSTAPALFSNPSHQWKILDF